MADVVDDIAHASYHQSQATMPGLPAICRECRIIMNPDGSCPHCFGTEKTPSRPAACPWCALKAAGKTC